MRNQLQWTQDLGNAFLAQQADVMAAVQALRHEAMAAGNLKQTPQCRCVIQSSGETISIRPAEPQTVCVPARRGRRRGRRAYSPMRQRRSSRRDRICYCLFSMFHNNAIGASTTPVR
jgi:hypothetical protein